MLESLKKSPRGLPSPEEHRENTFWGFPLTGRNVELCISPDDGHGNTWTHWRIASNRLHFVVNHDATLHEFTRGVAGSWALGVWYFQHVLPQDIGWNMLKVLQVIPIQCLSNILGGWFQHWKMFTSSSPQMRERFGQLQRLFVRIDFPGWDGLKRTNEWAPRRLSNVPTSACRNWLLGPTHGRRMFDALGTGCTKGFGK